MTVEAERSEDVSGTDVLDNAAWHALRGAHAEVAVGDGDARRYDHRVSVFAATVDDSQQSWTALAELAGGRSVVLFRALPITPPPGWTIVQSGVGHQMVRSGPIEPPPAPGDDPVTGDPAVVRALGDADVAAMTDLVALTEPGPFVARTIELGGYVGVFHGDDLVAMAGQRLRPPGWCEISAVCTHPGARRRGYASLLTGIVAANIVARGERPFLHVAATNHPARLAYERLGFERRVDVGFAVLQPPPP